MGCREIVRKAEELVARSMKSNDASHDASHVWRVRDMALSLAHDHGLSSNPDSMLVVELAALLHDIGDYKYLRDPSEENIVENFLEEEGLEEQQKTRISSIIKRMGFKDELSGLVNSENSLEFGVVQDADRLDAIGAIGIARCLTFGGSRNRVFHDPNIPPCSDLSKEQYIMKEDQTTMNHFHEKLFKLKDLMKTETVKCDTMSCWPSGTSTPSVLSSAMSNEKHDVSQHSGQQNVDNKRVGRELGESSASKQRKLRSKVWEDFEKYKNKYGKDRARCKVCKKDFNGSSKSGTTHLKNHFRICKKRINGEEGGDEPANLASSSSNMNVIKEKYVMDQQLNHLDAARMIIKQGDAKLINSTNVGYMIDVYKEEKEKLRNYFEKLSKLSRRLCLTMQTDIYFNDCLTVWFIDDDWKLKNKIISCHYCPVGGMRTDKSIKDVLLEWGIENNISAMVRGVGYDFWYERISCNKNREDRVNTEGLLFFNNKLLCNEYFSFPDLGDDILFLIRDPLCAILRILFNNVRHDESFRNVIDAVELLEQNLRDEDADVLGALKSVLGLKETYFDLQNEDPPFLNLTKHEWDALSALYECLEDSGVFLRQYCSNYYTANIHFPLLCSIFKCCDELRKCDPNDDYDDFMERAGYYWIDYNFVLAVASILDPRFKMDIVKNWCKKVFGDEWKWQFTEFRNYFNKVYNEYESGINECTSAVEENKFSFSYEMLDPLGKLCKSSHELDHVQWLNPELRLYFEEVKFPSINDFDILEWWRAHSRYFPTLARMARDFLSIQVSCHPTGVSADEIDCLEKYYIKDSDDEMVYAAEVPIEEAYICAKSWLHE